MKNLLMAGALGWLAWNLTKPDYYRGQTVMITGGTRGLGLCLARELKARGANVAICARSRDELRRVRVELGGIHTAVCDVSDPDQVRQWVEHVRRLLGPVDLLINNAGVIVVGPLETMTLEEFRQCMDTMFWGTVYPTLELLGELKGVINVTSIGGRVTVPHLLPYCCAKAAAVAFSEGVRMERPDLRVLTAVPGLMRTGSFGNARFRGRQAEEYGWFSLASSLPGLSMDARRAARELLSALERNKGEHRVTLAAEVMTRAHGFMPALFTDLLGFFARGILPGANSSPPTEAGLLLQDEMPRWHERLMILGRKAEAQHQRHRSEPLVVHG